MSKFYHKYVKDNKTLFRLIYYSEDSIQKEFLIIKRKKPKSDYSINFPNWNIFSFKSPCSTIAQCIPFAWPTSNRSQNCTIQHNSTQFTEQLQPRVMSASTFYHFSALFRHKREKKVAQIAFKPFMPSCFVNNISNENFPNLRKDIFLSSSYLCFTLCIYIFWSSCANKPASGKLNDCPFFGRVLGCVIDLHWTKSHSKLSVFV